MRRALLAATAVPALMLGSCTAVSPDGRQAALPVGDLAGRCATVGVEMSASWPEPGTRITQSVYREAGRLPAPPGPPGMVPPAVDLPAHCDVTGVMRERIGVDGQHYAIRFHLRLPLNWNGRFFMQGGGGTNGDLGDAVGRLPGSDAPALAQGYAVLSQDSGHDNAVNTVAERGGASAFGHDPQARADYGGASLAPVTLAAKALVARFYGTAPRYSYFFGCSKGGQEGMVLAQRYPELYDGIVAGAPGFALPRAALAEAWDTQSFASIPRAAGTPVTLATLAASFSDADLDLARQAVLDACDRDDGAKDGIIGSVGQCSSAKVVPALEKKSCAGARQDGCLSRAQIDALVRVHDGPRNSRGEAIYAGFPWDSGWAGMGWRIWKIGSADGRIPPINVMMGAPSLAAIFTVPPSSPGASPDALLAYHLNLDFDRDAPAIYATGGRFVRSAWQDIGARSTDLAGFRKRGGRMIVPHGVSDPVFSVADTMAWWDEVDRRSRGRAAEFARVFPVPGMAHCMGGPATDRFDAFGALVRWVEHGEAPERIIASAGPMSPWPGRSRPLCRHPLTAKLKPGAIDLEAAESFSCTNRQ